MKPEQKHQAIDTLIENMEGAERRQFFNHLRDAYPQELGAAALNGTSVEAPAENEGHESKASSLTAKQERKAAKLTTAMAERFGVPAEDFSIIAVETGHGDTRHVVVYTAPNGIDLGNPQRAFDKKRSWNAIFGRDDKKADVDFKVTVGLKRYDTRSGMTWDTYQAFIEDAQARGINPLPDSQELAEQNGEVWTRTWLTGDKNRVRPWLASVGLFFNNGFYGEPSSREESSEKSDAAARFRPAVVVSER